MWSNRGLQAYIVFLLFDGITVAKRLSTHIWHAKRMKMKDMWGYRIALHPTEKCFQRLQKSSLRSCVIQDASFMQHFAVCSSSREIIIQFMNSFTGTTNSVDRFTDGHRVGQSLMYRYGAYPRDFLCPFEFQWMPTDTADEACLWITVHPSVSQSVLESINKALETRKQEISGNFYRVITS